MTFARTFSDVDPDARPDRVGDVLRARGAEYGDKPYMVFVDDGDMLSYRAAADRSADVARGLLALGLAPGANLGFVLPACAAYVLGWFATLQAAMVDVPINPEFRGDVLAHAIRKIDICALFADREGLNALASAGAAARDQIRLIVLPDEVHGTLGPDDRAKAGACRLIALSEVEALGRASARALPAIDPRALASIRFSSGTTGLPKGVMMDHGHMLSNARKVGQLMEMGEREVMYTCFPFHHVFAPVMGALMTLCAGGTIIVSRRFSVQRYWNHLRDHGVTRAHVLDPLIPLLMKQPADDRDRAHKVRLMYTAAGHYPDFEARFGVNIVPIYDMSELTCVMHYPRGEARRPGSCGKASGLFDIKIADDEGFALPDGTDGEIYVRPRHQNLMFLGYYNDPLQTVTAWRDLWFRTGDRARRDADGYYYFLGRAGDRIRRRGVNISAEQVEAVALSHPAVLECAAIGVPSPLGEDDIKLCMRLAPGAAADHAALAEDLLDMLPRTLTVRYFELLDDLPKTQTEKVKRAALRAQGARGMTAGTWDQEEQCFWSAAAPARA